MTDACGYQKGGAGTCNSTVFGYPFEPLGNMLADTPKDFKKQTVDVIGTDATAFKDDGYNGTATRAASLLTFVSSFFHIHRLLWPAFWIYILSNGGCTLIIGRIMPRCHCAHYRFLQSKALLPSRSSHLRSLSPTPHDVSLFPVFHDLADC
jgi:hypothetical protein